MNDTQERPSRLGEKWNGFVQGAQNITAHAWVQIPIAAKGVGESAINLGTNTIKPAIGHTTNVLGDFWNHSVVPAAENTAQGFENFITNNMSKNLKVPSENVVPASSSLNSTSKGDSDEYTESKNVPSILASPDSNLKRDSNEYTESEALANHDTISDVKINVAAQEFAMNNNDLIYSLSKTIVDRMYLVRNIDPFLKDTQKLIEHLHESVNLFREEHPYITAAIGAALLVAGASVILPAVSAALLNIAGWSATGPVAGSLAASIQSAVYGAWTTGIFSILQSFTMTYISPSVIGIILAGSSTAAGGYLVSSLRNDPRFLRALGETLRRSSRSLVALSNKRKTLRAGGQAGESPMSSSESDSEDPEISGSGSGTDLDARRDSEDECHSLGSRKRL